MSLLHASSQGLLRQQAKGSRVAAGSISALRIRPFTRIAGRAAQPSSLRTRAAEPDAAGPTEAEEVFEFNFSDAKKGNEYNESDVTAAMDFYAGEGDAPGDANAGAAAARPRACAWAGNAGMHGQRRVCGPHASVRRVRISSWLASHGMGARRNCLRRSPCAPRICGVGLVGNSWVGIRHCFLARIRNAVGPFASWLPFHGCCCAPALWRPTGQLFSPRAAHSLSLRSVAQCGGFACFWTHDSVYLHYRH